MAENCLGPWDLQPLTASSNEYYDLGDYIACTVSNVWTYAQIILIAVAIIMVMGLIYKTATNRDNTSVLEELQKQWPYTMLLAIVVIGGAGSLLNIALGFFGFGTVDIWLKVLTDFLKMF